MGIYNREKSPTLQQQQQQKHLLVDASARPSVVGADPPGLGIDGERRALVGLAAADDVPEAGEDDAGHEDDGGVVHVLESNRNGGRHGEEGDGEADPG